MGKRVVVYSHGFGVCKDDRGLFTDIVVSLSDVEHFLFDYNKIEEDHNVLTVAPLTEQRTELARSLASVRDDHPDAEVDLVCHSQGCIVAAMLNPMNIRRAILLAPPSELSTEHMLKVFTRLPGAEVDTAGLTKFPRRDGSTTIVPADYWLSVQNINPVQLYNAFAETTALTIIDANQDEVLVTKDFSALSAAVNFLPMDANHDFTDESRPHLLSAVRKILSEQ